MIQMTGWCGSTTARGQSLGMEPLVSEPQWALWIFDKAKTQRVNSQAEGLWVPSGGAGGTQSHVHRVVSQVWQRGI